MIARFLTLALALVTAALIAAPARADLAEDRAGLATLQAEDLRMQSIGWRLATGNARFCNAKPAIGLLLQDMANYMEPARMRAAAGIAGDVAVQAVVPGSPAALAGLAPNDEILAIDGLAMAALPKVKAGDWQRLTGLHDTLDAALVQNRKVALSWRDGQGRTHQATVAGVATCPTRFELGSSGGRAVADGARVIIGRKFAGVGYAEDEFAAALSHEFAHNLLTHKLWLRGKGRSVKNIRTTEGEADRLMPWLLANAGYEPEAAVRFFQRWGPGGDGWIFRARTHDGWDERVDAVRGELPQVEALIANDGAANWRTQFRRDTAN